MRHLLSVADLSESELGEIIGLATTLKRRPTHILKEKVLGMIFEKPSTRTRVSFEVAMTQLGGHAIYLNKNDIQIGRGETIADTSRVLSRYCDFLMARVFSHKTLEELSSHASVPVINGLSDMYHPCQIIADLLTIQEKFGKLMGLNFAYVGDGNNVCNSLLLGCAMVGMHVRVGCPPGFKPNKSIELDAIDIGKKSNATVDVMTDPMEAVEGADIIYTDTWVSMGDEKESGAREFEFLKYQVNSRMTSHASSDFIFMHCLPAHRGEEVTNNIIDSPHSAVWDQAENRLHAQKAILAFLDKKR